MYKRVGRNLSRVFIAVLFALQFSGCSKLNSALEQAGKGAGENPTNPSPSAPGVVKKNGTIIDGAGSQVYTTNSFKISGISIGGLTRQTKATSTSFMVQGGFLGR